MKNILFIFQQVVIYVYTHSYGFFLYFVLCLVLQYYFVLDTEKIRKQYSLSLKTPNYILISMFGFIEDMMKEKKGWN